MAEAITSVFSDTLVAVFSESQTAQFRRSVQELVGWLKADFAAAAPELENFCKLLDAVAQAKLELPEFAEKVAACILHSLDGASRNELTSLGEALLGLTYLPKCKDVPGSAAYWEAKEAADEKLQIPVFLDLADGNTRALPVADPRTGRLVNQFLLDHKPPTFDSRSRRNSSAASHRKTRPAEQPSPAKDAYSGQDCRTPDKFPEPKLVVLGNTKLFSNNTAEAGCFYRYGLGESDTFKVSAESAERMSGALFTLAGDELALPALGGRPSLGRTCRPIPSSRESKQDLLIAYLEDEPDAPDPYVELFGNEAASYDAPDFAASAKPVLAALEGKVAANPNQLIRLIAIAAVDKANKQISLNRSFTVREVMEAAKAWQAGAANCPSVTLPFFSKDVEKPVTTPRTVPSPLDVASVLNKVWRSSGDGGFESQFNRIVSASDAYDIFLLSSPLRESKTRFALQAILRRMSDVLASAAVLKITWDFKALNEPARWCVLKAVALTGIFLHQLGFQHDHFMKGTIYHIGQLLALADRLHFHYCKWVRTSAEKRQLKKVDAPAELLGNALFNFALDNPVGALARLAERIRPYKGWATTYSGEEAGIARWLLGLLSECEQGINLEELQSLGRLEDVHKAQLLLGYLADLPKAEEPPVTETTNEQPLV